MKPTKLYESLFILDKCKTTINSVWNELLKGKHFTKNDVLSTNLQFYLIMETVNFLKEYDGAFVNRIEPEFKERMMSVRKIASPIIKELNKWKDLERFRNNIIAHGWRDKNKNYEFVVPVISAYNIPRNGLEFGILRNLILYAYYILQCEFSKEIFQSMQHVASKEPPPIPGADYAELNKQHYAMMEEVHSISEKLGKSCNLKVVLYKLPGDTNYDQDDPNVPTIGKW
jgi:hypothetical protein